MLFFHGNGHKHYFSQEAPIAFKIYEQAFKDED
jgi:hypothetical protein